MPRIRKGALPDSGPEESSDEYGDEEGSDQEEEEEEEEAAAPSCEEGPEDSEEEGEQQYGSIGKGRPPLGGTAANSRDAQRSGAPGRSTSGPGALQGSSLSRDPNHKKCSSMIKKCQLEADELRDENKILKKNLASAQARIADLMKKSSEPPKKPAKVGNEWGNLASNVPILWAYRYQSEENDLICTRVELFDVIPDKYHKDLVKPGSCAQEFKRAADGFFRQKVRDLRTAAAQHVFAEFDISHLAMYYGYSYNTERATIPEFQKLLKWPEGSKEAEQAGEYFLPIHFPNGILDFSKVFQVKWMSLLLRSLLYGPASVEPKVLRDQHWKIPAVCNGRKWGVSEVNPAALALAAMLGPFMHNCDASIEAVGQQSKFEYMNAFNYYKQFFIENLIEGGDSALAMVNLFSWHNGYAFPSYAGVPTPNESKKAANNEVRAAARKAFSSAAQVGGSGSSPPVASSTQLASSAEEVLPLLPATPVRDSSCDLSENQGQETAGVGRGGSLPEEPIGVGCSDNSPEQHGELQSEQEAAPAKKGKNSKGKKKAEGSAGRKQPTRGTR